MTPRELLRRAFDCCLLLVLVYWAVVLTLFFSDQPIIVRTIGTSDLAFKGLMTVQLAFVVFVWTRMIGPGWRIDGKRRAHA